MQPLPHIRSTLPLGSNICQLADQRPSKPLAVWVDRGHLGPSWAILGASWKKLGGVWGNLGGDLEASWGHLGGILGASWAIFGYLGPSWGHLGGILGHLGAILGHLGGILGHLGASWGVSGVQKSTKNRSKIDKKSINVISSLFCTFFSDF